MDTRPLEQLTLREKLTEAERVTRELIEHLDRGFIPKAHELRRVVRPHYEGPDGTPVQDVTVRNHAARVLESDQFTEKLYEKLDRYFAAIATEVSQIVEGA